ncbi:MAG: hydantoinase/oxoprolinase family protein [Pseudomonadota bacterium]
MSTRIGVDIGGTFTDLIFYDDVLGEISIAKVPTTPSSPDQGSADAVAAALDKEKIEQSEYFLHGTTVGLNALLERRGAKVGLLCTEGFRDTLEIRRGSRAEMYNLFWQPPEPLVPRQLRLPIMERMKSDGSVLKTLNEDKVHEALEVFTRQGVSAIAIAFLNAYANPAHEKRVAEIIKASGFEGVVSCSHVVSGEYREYERTCTTVIDAFVQARMANYLDRLKAGLLETGFQGECLITRSGGGAMNFKEAAERSFETIMSGPVAGVEGASELARRFDLGDVITADVGGTSFDACVVKDGRPILLFEGEIAGFPLQTPWVDVRSIGAGGGSIAYVDKGQLLRVGPQSAGAVPGPACYQKGGVDPCLSDAFLKLGMLGTGQIANGMRLDFDLAENAISSVAKQLDWTTEETACGIVRIAGACMANTIREITIEQGRDPRDMLLMAFGGAGPVIGTVIADELGIARVMIPEYAGNFSAWGLLGADLVKSTSLTRIMPARDESIPELNKIFASLFSNLRSTFQEQTDCSDYRLEANIDMRYVGQEHVVSVAVPLDGDHIAVSGDDVAALFTKEYANHYGVTLDETPIEIVVMRATMRRALPERDAKEPSTGNGSMLRETLDVYSFERQRRIPFELRERHHLSRTEKFHGPMIITEATTTTYVDDGWVGDIHACGGLMLTKKERHDNG